MTSSSLSVLQHIQYRLYNCHHVISTPEHSTKYLVHCVIQGVMLMKLLFTDQNCILSCDEGVCHQYFSTSV